MAVRYLVRHGYREIVILKHEEREEVSGYQHSFEDTELAARDSNGKPFHIFHCAHDASEGRIERTEPIEESLFANFLATHVRQDTAEFLDSLTQSDAVAAAKTRQQRSAQMEFDQLRPTCPKCQSPMTLRQPRDRDTWFWGCPQYPTCKCTRNVLQTDWGRIQLLLKDGAG